MFDGDLKDYLAIILDKGFAGHAIYIRERSPMRLDAWKGGAEQNDPPAQFFLGLCHAHEAGVALDALESLRLIQLSAEQGFAPAQTQLALHYEEGREVKHDMTEAMRWYTRSAEAGFMLAQYRLGWMYEGGRGVTQDVEESLHWYRLAAEQGFITAQFDLARMCEEGRAGGPLISSKPLTGIVKPRKRDMRTAQYAWGHLHELGRGALQSDTEAVKWYTKAAEQTYEAAMHSLAWMYEEGRGVNQDYSSPPSGI